MARNNHSARCGALNLCAVETLYDELYLTVLHQHFHEAAYQADDRQDLLSAINRFLDCSAVLPPSEVAGDELLHSVAHFQREMLRKREEQQEKRSSVQQDEGRLSQ